MKPTRSPSSTTRSAIEQLDAGRGHRASSVDDLMDELSARFEATGDPRRRRGERAENRPDTGAAKSKRSSLGR